VDRYASESALLTGKRFPRQRAPKDHDVWDELSALTIIRVPFKEVSHESTESAMT